MRRRRLLGALATSSLGAAGLGWAITARPTPDAGDARTVRVKTDDVDRLRAQTARLYALDYQHGGESLWQAASVLSNQAHLLLERGTYRPTVGRDLVAATSRLAMCAGWLAFDAGAHDARHHLDDALCLARQADDREVEVHALANLAALANALGHPREADRLAETAERRATGPGLPPRITVIPQFRRALASANLGDSRACDLAIAKARRALDTTADQPTTTWLAFVTPAEVDGIEATCAATLGRTRQAETLLTTAIAQHPDPYARTRALYRLRLARLHLTTGEIHEATTTTHQALDDLTHTVSSWRVQTELSTVLVALTTNHRRADGVEALLTRHNDLAIHGTPHSA